jgi:hypothetical protein
VIVSNNVSSGAAKVLDGITVARAYGLIKLRTAYAGSCIRVERASDTTQQDIGFDGSGVVDIGAYNTFVSGTTGTIVKWYDQSGNGQDATQTTLGSRPVLSSTGLASKPSTTYNGSSNYFIYPEALSGTGNKSAFVVYKNTQVGTFVSSVLSQSTGTTTGTWFDIMVRNSGANGNPYFSGYAADMTDGSLPDTNPVLAGVQYDGTNGYLRKNGAQIDTDTMSLNTTASSPNIGADSGFSYFKGEISIVIMANSYITGADLTQIEARLNAYYAIY